MSDAVPYPFLERLTQIATGEDFIDAVRDAKSRYFRATGEVFEDDAFFESRMNGFIEYYLFDYPAGPGGKSSTALIVDRMKLTLPPDDLVAFAGFDRNVHSIFEYKKKKGELVTVQNLYDDEKYEVHERRALAGLEKGDVFEARLLPLADKLHFSNAFVFHPAVVKKFIVSEMKAARATHASRPTSTIHRMAYLRLKFERFRRVDVTRIYSRETMAQIEAEQKREVSGSLTRTAGEKGSS